LHRPGALTGVLPIGAEALRGTPMAVNVEGKEKAAELRTGRNVEIKDVGFAQ